MSLKTEIDKINKLKEDLKLAKENINARILSGGGTKADTISDVPDKISSMLGNYKKISILDLNIVCPGSTGHFKKRIATNLKFTPTMCFVIMNNGLTQSQNIFGPTIGETCDGSSLKGTVTNITKDFVDVDIFIDYPYHEGKTKVTQLVAIE